MSSRAENVQEPIGGPMQLGDTLPDPLARAAAPKYEVPARTRAATRAGTALFHAIGIAYVPIEAWRFVTERFDD